MWVWLGACEVARNIIFISFLLTTLRLFKYDNIDEKGRGKIGRDTKA